jgi:heavy metal efflux system protein
LSLRAAPARADRRAARDDAGAGVVSFLKLNIEAYPDPVPPLVDIVTQSTGQSAEEIERYITIPIEIQMAGIPNVQAIRTISLFGLSDVKVQFTYDFTYQQAEQWVINRLSQLGRCRTARSRRSRPTSPIGEIYRYRVVGPPGYSVTDLKTIEDWMLERRFKAVPGRHRRHRLGRQDQDLRHRDRSAQADRLWLSVPQVLQALGNANINVGGQTVNFGAQAAVVRGVGLIHSGRHPQHDDREQRHAGAARRRRDGDVGNCRASASPARTMTTTSSRASC